MQYARRQQQTCKSYFVYCTRNYFLFTERLIHRYFISSPASAEDKEEHFEVKINDDKNNWVRIHFVLLTIPLFSEMNFSVFETTTVEKQ